MTLNGRYFDSKVSTAHHITLALDAAGMLSAQPQIFEPLPFSQVKVSSRLGNISRVIHLPSGAVIETDDHDVLDAWLRTYSKYSGWTYHLESRLSYALGALLFIALFIGGSIFWGIPWASNMTAKVLPDGVSVHLGQGVLESMDKLFFEPTQLSEERQTELRQRFVELLPETTDGFDYSLEFRNSNLIGPNAFALPDGTIVMTDDLAALAANDDEIISVLLHEVGHIVHRHSLRQIITHSGLTVLTALLTGDVSSAGTMIMAVPSILMNNAYSREFESEADTYALEEMQRRGIATDHFANFMLRLEEYALLFAGEDDEGQDESEWVNYMSTHPPTEERIARFRTPGYVFEDNMAEPELLPDDVIPERPDIFALRALLEKHEFALLHEKLHAYQLDYENGKSNDLNTSVAFNAFAVTDPAYAELLDLWVKTMPDAYTAFMARGNYHYAMSWVRPDEESVSVEKKDKQSCSAKSESPAITDLEGALLLNPKLTAAYATLISVAAEEDKYKLKQEYTQKGLELDPASYDVRRTALYYMSSGWDASYYQIADFVNETGKHLQQNQDLQSLLGYLYYAKSRETYSNDEYDKTIKLTTAAIKKGKASLYYSKRADAYYSKDDFTSAIIDYSNAIKLNPYSAYNYLWRSHAYHQLEQNKERLNDLQAAARIEPYDHDVHSYLGYALADAGRYEEAIRSLEIALYYEQDDAYLWNLIAWNKNKYLDKPQDALEPIKKAMDIEPENPDYWYTYASVLDNLKDCEIMGALNTYLELCNADDQQCYDESVKWAREMRTTLKKTYCR